MITREQAMANIALAEVQLCLARDFAKKYPDPENIAYAALVQKKRDAAYLEYTDPFRSKTYA